MELTFFFVDPLPPRLGGKEAVELKVNLLFKAFEIGFRSVTDAADQDSLARAWPFHQESDNQVYPEPFLVSVSDLIRPQVMALVLEALTVCLLEPLDGRPEPLIELK